jgi:hypothetical protein
MGEQERYFNKRYCSSFTNGGLSSRGGVAVATPFFSFLLALLMFIVDFDKENTALVRADIENNFYIYFLKAITFFPFVSLRY